MKMDEVARLERMLEVTRSLKARFAEREAHLVRLLKQAKMKKVNNHGTRS